MLTMKQFDKELHRLTTTGTYIKALRPVNQWTIALLNFLTGTGITYKICVERIGLTEILKLNDNYLKFLISMPHQSFEGQECDQFAWLIGLDPTKDEDCITPDEASAYLLEKKFPDTKVTNTRDSDGNHITKMKTGKDEINLLFPKEMFKNRTWKP